jgi:hypothetical protein
VLARSDHEGAVRGGRGVSEEYVTSVVPSLL